MFADDGDMVVLRLLVLAALVGIGVVAHLGVAKAGSVASAVDDMRMLCLTSALKVEMQDRLPKAIIQAIALTESGRFDRQTSQRYAWPWTVNNAGDSYFLNSKAEAIDLVKSLKRRGETNIDVGCMQVNLHFHPNAFSNLETAFDPMANARYASDFLRRLRSETGTWARAIERYHSNDAARGRYYRNKVNKNWRLSRLGRTVLDREKTRELQMQIQANKLIKHAQSNIHAPSEPVDVAAVEGAKVNPGAIASESEQRVQRLLRLRDANSLVISVTRGSSLD